MKLFMQCFVCVALLSTPAFAISEKDYLKSFDSLVMPFYESAGVSGEFGGVGGVKISYRKFEIPNEKGAIVFAPGRGESYLTYPELEYDLVQAGFSVYVIDHRSQGFSGRIALNPQVVTVESYDNYVTDFTTFVDTVVNALLTRTASCSPTLWVDRSVLSTWPNTPRLSSGQSSRCRCSRSTRARSPSRSAWSSRAFETSIGHGDNFAKLGGEKPYDFNYHSDCNSPDGHLVRRCEIENLVTANPATASGGSSYRWVAQSLETTRQIRKGLGTQIQIPLLIFQAGRDQLVMPGGEDTFCSQAPHCLKITFPTSSHEILTERDEIRTPAVRSIIEFLGQ